MGIGAFPRMAYVVPGKPQRKFHVSRDRSLPFWDMFRPSPIAALSLNASVELGCFHAYAGCRAPDKYIPSRAPRSRMCTFMSALWACVYFSSQDIEWLWGMQPRHTRDTRGPIARRCEVIRRRTKALIPTYLLCCIEG
jgi:hypothetical protein